MKNFRERLLSNSILTDSFGRRGYFFDLEQSDDANACLFTRKIQSDIDVRLYFSIKKPDCCSISILLSLQNVTKIFYDFDLFLDETKIPEGRAKTVLAVDLIRLRLDHRPESLENSKFDYQIDSTVGMARLLEDIDCVGEPFIRRLASIRDLAEFLSNLDKYESRTLYGGRPVSTDPYIYASVLYFLANDFNAAFNVLNKGEQMYSISDPLQWQKTRFENFKIRSEKLMFHIEKELNAPNSGFVA